jgi:hypothetical protein
MKDMENKLKDALLKDDDYLNALGKKFDITKKK